MNIWLRLQQTLYTKCISECVFGLLSLFIILFPAVESGVFHCAEDPCLMSLLLFLVSCYSLAKARPKV